MKAEKKNNLKNLGLIVGGLALTSFGASANSADLFSVNAIGSGGEIRSELTQMAKNTLNSESFLLEAKCGEEGAKKGEKGKKAETKGEEGKKAEAKCGEGKCGEGKCGEKAKKTETKGEEGKKAEAKCGEGKCGEGKCGEKK